MSTKYAKAVMSIILDMVLYISYIASKLYNMEAVIMSFREKIHWVALASISLAFGWYFLTLPAAVPLGPAGLFASAGLLLIPTLGIIVAMSFATALFALRNPAEAALREDERDRDFHVRGTHFAYYPMVVGSWLCIGLILGGVSQVALMKTLLAMVVAAELVRIGSQLWFYRQGR